MRQDYTHIAVVVDKSGSMQDRRSDVIGGFNRFLEDQRKAPGEATMTLVLFDTTYAVVHSGKDLRSVPPLTDDTYVPAGCTALHDATARAITESGKFLADLPEDRRPGKVVCVIITDGQENSSVETKLEQVREMIRVQRETYRWEFMFLGVGLEAFEGGQQLEVKTSGKVGLTAQCFAAAAAATSDAIRSYRSGEASCCVYTDEQRKKMAGDN
jgi:hypothetical protein